MKFLGKKKINGAIENVLLKGAESKDRKTNLLSGLQNTLSGLKEEEQNLRDIRSEMEGIMTNLKAENDQYEQELNSISAVRSNIEKLLGSNV